MSSCPALLPFCVQELVFTLVLSGGALCPTMPAKHVAQQTTSSKDLSCKGFQNPGCNGYVVDGGTVYINA